MDFLRFFETFDTDNLCDYEMYINYQTNDCFFYNILLDFCEQPKEVLDFFLFDKISINDIFADFKKYSKVYQSEYSNIHTLHDFYSEYHKELK
jgi:hypothetical protein